MPDGWVVGLPYYDSRIDVYGFVFCGCHDVTALQPNGNVMPNGWSVGLSYHDSRNHISRKIIQWNW